MTKHKIRNIANRAIPVAGNPELIPESGQIVEAKMNLGLKTQIQNKFFEDLGKLEVDERTEEDLKKEAKEEENFIEEADRYGKERDEDMSKPPKKKGKKSKKKKPSYTEGED